MVSSCLTVPLLDDWVLRSLVYIRGRVPGRSKCLLWEVSLCVSFLSSKNRRDISPDLRAIWGYGTVPVVTRDITEINTCCWKLLFYQSSLYCIYSKCCSHLTFGGFFLQHWFSGSSEHQNHLVGLLQLRLLDPSSRVSEVLNMGWGLGIYISYQFWGVPAGPGTLLQEPLPYRVSPGRQATKINKVHRASPTCPLTFLPYL